MEETWRLSMTQDLAPESSEQEAQNGAPHFLEKLDASITKVTAVIMDHRFGILALGVPIMGCISGLTNMGHGEASFIRAAINQMIHTGISSILILPIHAGVSKLSRTRAAQIVLPALVPAALSAAGCYAIHTFGLPYELRPPSKEPFLASLPTIGMVSTVIPLYHFAYYRHRLAGLFSKNRADTK